MNTLRLLLGLAEGEQDVVLQHCLTSAEALALSYCHLDALPEALSPVVLDMAVDLYRMGGYGQAEAPRGAVSAVTEGEQSIRFAGASADASGLLRNYAARLNAYRKLRWPKRV